MRNWKHSWNSKSIDLKDIGLSELIKLDGFDTGLSSYTEYEWMEMVEDAAIKSDLKNADTILEVGCGSGAFLYCLSSGRDLIVHGFDYSKPLIDVAKRQIPHGKFFVSEANTYSYKPNFYDKIYSHAVFFYFENYEYALTCIKKCYQSLKKGGTLCLMDLNDLTTQADYFRYRQSAFGDAKEYEKRYKGLSHLFFDKDLLINDIVALGFSEVHTFDHKIVNGCAKFRFNLLAKK
jgi:SAM-dependent methyltransferase